MCKALPLLCVLLSMGLSAQAPQLQWKQFLTGNSSDYPRNVLSAPGGGHLFCGWSASTDGLFAGQHGMLDFYLAKTGDNGQVEWLKTYGGSKREYAGTVANCTDGGYVFCTGSQSANGDVGGNQGKYDYWVVKVDGNGDIQWERSFGGSKDDFGNALVQTTDGGYLVVGESKSTDGDISVHHDGSDIWVLKLDGAGNLEWERSLGGSRYDAPSAVVEATDGGYVIAGVSTSKDGDVTGPVNGGYEGWVVKVDGAGSVVWQRILGKAGDDHLNDIQQTSDGAYILTGSTKQEDATSYYDWDLWLLKMDDDGNVLWEQELGDAGTESGSSVRECSDGGFVVAGLEGEYREIFGQNEVDVLVLKTDGQGQEEWSKSFGGPLEDQSTSCLVDADGSIVVLAQTQFGSTDPYSPMDVCLLKAGVPGAGMLASNGVKVMLTPNPAQEELRMAIELPGSMALQVDVLDATGRLMLTTDLGSRSSGHQEVRLPVAHLPQGAYQVVVRTAEEAPGMYRFLKQ